MYASSSLRISLGVASGNRMKDIKNEEISENSGYTGMIQIIFPPQKSSSEAPGGKYRPNGLYAARMKRVTEEMTVDETS